MLVAANAVAGWKNRCVPWGIAASRAAPQTLKFEPKLVAGSKIFQ
jgi:hypothetical protein